MLTAVANRTVRFVTAVMATAMLAGLPAAQADDKGQVKGALAYEPRTEALFKSDGGALYRSDDSGKNWTKMPLEASVSDGEVKAVTVAAATRRTLYVAGTGVGVLKSVDGGKSWVHVDQGLPSRHVLAFATHSAVPDTLYAVVAGEGIYRSEDGGVRWRMVDKGPDASIRRIVHSDLEGSMQSGWLFAATDKGVYRSMDCFCGWRVAGSVPAAVSAVAYDPEQPMELYAAVGRQVFSTVNGGEDWQVAGSPGDEVDALVYSPAGVLYALLGDGRLVRSRDKGRRWE